MLDLRERGQTQGVTSRQRARISHASHPGSPARWVPRSPGWHLRAWFLNSAQLGIVVLGGYTWTRWLQGPALFHLDGALPDNIDEIRRSCAEDIPHVLPALRKFAQIRSEEGIGTNRQSPKIGRNEPCPCDSGKKYKRCCGLN